MTTPNNRTRPFNTLTLLLALAALAAVALSLPLTTAMKGKQQLQEQRAEINHARYGLLDPSIWSQQISDMIERRMDASTWTPEDVAKTRNAVTGMLYQLIGEARRSLQGAPDQGFMGGIRRAGVDFCLGQFEEQVPTLAREMTAQMADPNSRGQMKQLIQQQLDQLMATTFSTTDRSYLRYVADLHECPSVADCDTLLGEKLVAKEAKIQPLVIAVLVLAIGVLLISFIRPAPMLRWQLLPPVLACIALLVGGVVAPMLSIEARISQLDVRLLGDSISFSNQILFYQNKSIVDVATLLLRSGELQLAFVSVLVVMFSVVFPLAKLLASLWIGFGKPPKLISGFFALKSSKWSLADVLVVALFMTFLGFSGVIERQLLPLATNTDTLTVLTTNGSQLEWGFTLFLAFCVASFLLSVRLGQALKTNSTSSK